MLNRTFQWLLVACLVTGTLWAANDPFLGKWKVNPSKNKLNDEMKVEVAGENRYAITFAPGAVDTVIADGSDQPALRGTTLSVTVKGPNSWEVIRKMKGRTLLTGYWTLSGDGKARLTTPIRNTRPTVRHRCSCPMYTSGPRGVQVFRAHGTATARK